MEVDNEWPWKILWVDEAHFHMKLYITTQNCWIWATENPLANLPVLFHSDIIGHYAMPVYDIIYHRAIFFFVETDTFSRVTCIATSTPYMSLLKNHVTPSLGWDHFYAKWLFSVRCKSCEAAAERHFGNVIIFRHHFPTDWSFWSPDPNPYDFGCRAIWKMLCSLFRRQT